MLIIPAILEEKSEDAIQQLDSLRGVVPWVQVDVMDGTMTESSTFDLTELVGYVDDFDVEVHLMTTDPIKYLDACEAIGAARVYFHLGAVESPSSVLSAMDPYSFSKGICLSPQTSVDDAFSYIDEVDAVQVMTVVPGAQGGKFLEPMLEKIPYMRERRTELWLSIDGGVNEKTLEQITQKAVDAVGVGSAISRADDPVDAINTLAVAIENYER